jgi:hypothetical protein
MIDTRKARHLMGETIRDIGILVIVFGPLDAFFQKERSSFTSFVASMVAGALLLIIVGIIIEADQSGDAS